MTQLVVHSEFRNKGIAKKLLSTLYQDKNNYAWGLVTNSPYAVRALESVTNRRCSPSALKENTFILWNSCMCSIPYISTRNNLIIDDNLSCIFTSFFTDRSKMKEMLKNVTSAFKPWRIGILKPGHEWLAVTFRN